MTRAPPVAAADGTRVAYGWRPSETALRATLSHEPGVGGTHARVPGWILSGEALRALYLVTGSLHDQLVGKKEPVTWGNRSRALGDQLVLVALIMVARGDSDLLLL